MLIMKAQRLGGRIVERISDQGHAYIESINEIMPFVAEASTGRAAHTNRRIGAAANHRRLLMWTGSYLLTPSPSPQYTFYGTTITPTRLSPTPFTRCLRIGPGLAVATDNR